MTDTPVVPFPRRGGLRLEVSGASGSTPAAVRSAQPIEITAPDSHSAALLLGYAAPLFAAEIVAGSASTVRLELPASGEWMVALLSLVEHWLESAGLACAAVRCGGRSYLIRAEGDGELLDAGWSSARREPGQESARDGAPVACVELDARRNDRPRRPDDGVRRAFGGEVIRIESRKNRARARELEAPQPA